jgi:hypothetical protein
MNCQEIQSLWGLYHDLELDQSQMQLIRSHLQGCSACGQFYQSQDHFDLTLTAALQRGNLNDALWATTDVAVRRAFLENESVPDAPVKVRESVISWMITAGRDLLWPSPKYYAVLATIWIILLVINFRVVDGTIKPAAAAPGHTALSQTQFSLIEYRRELLLELATKESSDDKSSLIRAPRSELRQRSTTEPAQSKNNSRTTRSAIQVQWRRQFA